MWVSKLAHAPMNELIFCCRLGVMLLSFCLILLWLLSLSLPPYINSVYVSNICLYMCIGYNCLFVLF